MDLHLVVGSFLCLGLLEHFSLPSEEFQKCYVSSETSFVFCWTFLTSGELPVFRIGFCQNQYSFHQMLNFYKKMVLVTGGKWIKTWRKRIQADPGFSSYPSMLLICLFSETSWVPSARFGVTAGPCWEGIESVAAQPAVLLGLDIGPLAPLGIVLMVWNEFWKRKSNGRCDWLHAFALLCLIDGSRYLLHYILQINSD